MTMILIFAFGVLLILLSFLIRWLNGGGSKRFGSSSWYDLMMTFQVLGSVVCILSVILYFFRHPI